MGRARIVTVALAVTYLLGISPLHSQVTGPSVSLPGSLVVLDSEVQDSRTIWMLNYPERFDQFREHEGKLFIAMPNEKIKFSLIVIPNDISQPLKIIPHVIDIKEPDPEPDFSIDLTFKKTDTLFLVYESGKSDPSIAKIANSTFWLETLQSKGYQTPQVRDKDSEKGKELVAKTGSDVPFFVIERMGEVKSVFHASSVDELKEELGL